MKSQNIVALLIMFAGLLSSPAEEYKGIEFPQGALSFADEVISYDPSYSSGAVPTHPNFLNPADAIGIPDYPDGQPGATGSVALGSGGRIIVRFNNNALTGSDDSTHDLHIFEIGGDVEDTFIDISNDATNWHSLGKVFGSTASIDIDAFGFTSSNTFYYVRLTDDPNQGPTNNDTVGADIDAVGAISTIPEQDRPELQIETAILLEFQSALGSTYIIEESTNLVTWTDSIIDIEGDSSVKKFFFEITTPKKYYRIQPPEE